MVDIDIYNIVHELLPVIGVRDNIKEYPLKELIRAGKVKNCIELMANYMGLPIRADIMYGSVFETQNLVTTDEKGKGTSGITAQVFMPSNLPIYNTKLLTNFPINIQIKGDVKNHPYTFMAIMAHELSHVLLHSIQNINKNNEFYTDIAAMMLGFNEVFKTGRETIEMHLEKDLFGTKTITETTKYGYLDDYQFRIAYDLVFDLLRKNNNLKSDLLLQYEALVKHIDCIQKNIATFRKHLYYLDTHLKKKLKPGDAQKIIEFHKPDYISSQEISIQNIINKLYSKKSIQSIHYYLENWAVAWSKDLDVLEEKINTEESLLKQDLDILNRNLSIKDKFNLAFNKEISPVKQ